MEDEEWREMERMENGKIFFTPILHFERRRNYFLNLERMDPPQFRERVPHPHSPKI